MKKPAVRQLGVDTRRAFTAGKNPTPHAVSLSERRRRGNRTKRPDKKNIARILANATRCNRFEVKNGPMPFRRWLCAAFSRLDYADGIAVAVAGTTGWFTPCAGEETDSRPIADGLEIQ